MTTQSSGGQDKDDGVHDGFKEVEGDQATDTSHTLDGSDKDTHEHGAGCVDEEEEGSGYDREKGGSDESSDGKGDQGVGEKLSSLLLGDTSSLRG